MHFLHTTVFSFSSWRIFSQFAPRSGRNKLSSFSWIRFSSPPPQHTFRHGAISLAAEDLDEGPSELDVERGVDHRVEGAVDVAQPSERAVKPGGHVACPAVGVKYVSHKERQPADEEHPWRSAERGREQAQARTWWGTRSSECLHAVKLCFRSFKHEHAWLTGEKRW